MTTRNEALALIAGADAAPQLIHLLYAQGDEDEYRRAVDVVDALGVDTRVSMDGEREEVVFWLNDSRELHLVGPPNVRTHTPVENLASLRVGPSKVPGWAA